MPTVAIWIVAVVSVALLVGGGLVIASASLRRRLSAARRRAAALQTSVDPLPDDPFGELRLLRERLTRLRERLGQDAQALGLPPDPDAPPIGTPAPEEARSAVTRELEQDLELFKKELYDKSRRIEALEEEKRTLAGRILELEEQARRRPPPGVGEPLVLRSDKTAPTQAEEMVALMDALQQEADDLRRQLADREQRLKRAQSGDSSGLIHELERIRKELLQRNEEVADLEVKVHRADQQIQKLKARATELEHEKESVAARALESAAELRQANQRLQSLERQQASAAVMATPPPAGTPVRTMPLPGPASRSSPPPLPPGSGPRRGRKP